jgi:hypothetical protein
MGYHWNIMGLYLGYPMVLYLGYPWKFFSPILLGYILLIGGFNPSEKY